MMESNPVYQRLIRKGGWLTEHSFWRLALWSGGITVLATVAAYVFDPGMDGPPAIVPYAMLVILLLIVVMTPFITLVFTAMTVANDVLREDFGLLRLTKVSSKEVVVAYCRVAYARLAFMHAICIGLIPGFAISFAHMLTALYLLPYHPTIGTRLLSAGVVGVLVAIIPLGIMALLIGLLWWVANTAGVWAGLRWGQNASIVALGLGLGFVVLALGFILATNFVASLTFRFCLPLMCIVPLGFPWVIYNIGERLMRNSEQYMENEWANKHS